MLKVIRVWLLTVMAISGAALPALAGNNSGQAFTSWPDTGQAKCYNDTTEIPCPAAGAAFYGQDAQYNGPAHSYTSLGDETMIQDNVTGLIWEMKTAKNGAANYADPHDADNTYTWCDTEPTTNGGNQGACGTNDTMDFLAALNAGAGFGSHTDWRLPTIKELVTLVDWGRVNPSIDPLFATTTQPLYYWSSTTFATYTAGAWLVNFGYGNDYADLKSSGYYVRAVRGGQ